MNSFLKSLQTNWRDLLFFLLIGLGLAIVGGLIDYVAALFGTGKFVTLVLPTVSNYLQGFSRFVGASLTATFVWMLLWPTVNRFGNDSFNLGWTAMGLRGQFITYVSLIGVALIAAAICFSK